MSFVLLGIQSIQHLLQLRRTGSRLVVFTYIEPLHYALVVE